ncbi:MAG: alpha/beta hydrolase [Treponema sp.]|jgi:3-oxoadipate enol-lactonase|nr:alpha/beta hydrolase [Treponema sp.]
MPVFNCDGVDLYYEIHGDENSEHTVAFFNGVMASVSSWHPMIPVFEKTGFKIILHDFKGQMKSGKPEGMYSFAQHAAEAKALFQHVSVEHAHIIGTSYGGEVAMKLAILYPEITDSISIIDSVSELDEVLKGFVLSWKTLCDAGDGETFFWGMAPSLYGPDFFQKNREMLAGRARATKNAPPDYFAGQKRLYDAFVQDVYMTDELGRITCPALVICGEDDILKKPKFSKIIADSILDSEYITIPDCGHVAIFEKTGELCSAVLGFIMKHIAA